MTIEYTISLGQIVIIAIAVISGLGAVGGFLFAFGAIKQKFDDQTSKIMNVQESLKDLNKVVIAIAVQDTRIGAQDTRITNVERDIRDLKNGRGFINNRQDGGVQGEYP